MPLLRVTALDEEVVVALRDHFKLGRLDSFTPHGRPDRTVYLWQTKGPSTLWVLLRTRPHLLGEQRRRAESVLERTGYDLETVGAALASA